ncbi:MAG: 6,7-dimethyl-8-ribityllumazine synthase [bacterium]
MSPRTVEGMGGGRGRKAVIAASRFNREVVEGLVEGAVEVLTGAGVDDGDITLIWTPGALELPLVLRRAVRSLRPDLAVALGCVIRGETAHFEHVGRASIDGLVEVSLEEDLPVGIGILTVDTLEQARVRSGRASETDPAKEEEDRHRGREAARAALETAGLLEGLKGTGD